MEKGSVDVADMFYSTDAYNLVSFEDIWERKGRLGLFVPGYMGLNEHKNERGETDVEASIKSLTDAREKLIVDKAAKTTLEQEIMYRPLKPSEAFMKSSGNIFPRMQLQEQLTYISNNKDVEQMCQVGQFVHDHDGNLKWVQTSQNRYIRQFPLKDKKNADADIAIWEHPVDNPPHGLYIAGCDPYDHDKSETGSLGSIFIYKRFNGFDGTYNMIVAEYSARPERADTYYENLKNLLIYYNARCLYENERKGLHQHLVSKGQDWLLVDQPDIVKDIVKNTSVDREKGIHMVTQIKDWGERSIRDWLTEEYSPGKMNLNRIFSQALLSELLLYEDDGNYDRVMALMCVIILDKQMFKVRVKEKETESRKIEWKDLDFGGKVGFNYAWSGYS